MSINTLVSKSAIINERVSKKPTVLASALLSISLVMAMSMATVSAQAAGLNDLFGKNNATQSKFLPVEEAFQVNAMTKATSQGTRLSIMFDITPGHYVYKNQLTLRFPKGVSASPLTFSESPVFINDPTFGKVPVFTQRSMVATTVLSTKNGKAAKNVPVIIGWQGCAKAGLCYPPEKIKTTVDIAVARK